MSSSGSQANTRNDGADHTITAPSRSDSPPIDLRAFEAYSRTFDGLNASVPHRQGMTIDELQGALDHPQTVRCVALDQPDVELPVATPIEVYDWLSPAYFERRYPDLAPEQMFHVSANAALLDSVDIAGLVDFFGRITDEDHLLVTDYSVFDGVDPALAAGGIPRPITDALAKSGCRLIVTEEIGVQHYFGGSVVLNDRSAVRESTAVDLSQAYSAALARGDLADLADAGVVMLDSLTDAQIGQAWDLYVRYIESLNYDTPVLESLDYDTFVAEMQDPVVHKFVSMREGDIVSMCFLSADLSRYGWLSDAHLRTRYPDDFSRQNIFEFPGLFTDASARGWAHSGRVIRLVVRVLLAAGTDGRITFDCPQQTHRTVSGVVAAVINKGGVSKVDLIEACQQRYLAFRLG